MRNVMIITEEHIHKLKIFNRVEIYDENHYSWTLKLEDNFVTIKYGADCPFEYDSIPYSSDTEKFLVKLEKILHKAKAYFIEAISSSLGMKIHYANMIVTEKDIEKLKKLGSLIISDKKDCFWEIKITDNILEISYGTIQNQLIYIKEECTMEGNVFHEVIEKLVWLARYNYNEVNGKYETSL